MYKETGKPEPLEDHGMDEANEMDQTNNTDIVDIKDKEATSKNVQDLINREVHGGGALGTDLNAWSKRKESKNSQ